MRRSAIGSVAAACVAAATLFVCCPTPALAKVTYQRGTRDVPTWTVDGTTYDSEQEADAAADALRPEVTKTTSQSDFWRTSDGQEFATEAEAQDHVAALAEWDDSITGEVIVFSDGHVCLTAKDAADYSNDHLDLSYSVKSVTGESIHNSRPWAQSIETWMTYVATIDGTTALETFDTMEEAEAWCEARQAKVTSTGYSWRVSDGQEFSSYDEAYKHAYSISPHAIGSRQQRVVWKTSGGKVFDTEGEAEAHGKTLYLTVSKGMRDVMTWHCEGMSFSTEGEAIEYSRSLVPVTVGARQVSGWRSSDGRWFDTEEEAAAWASEQNDKGEWRHDSRGWWFAYAKGGYPAGAWEQIEGDWYLFDASGYMLTGWQQADGAWYYLEASGAMGTGWRCLGGAWYWLGESGAMATGWAEADGSWYYFDGAGAMLTGWQSVGGTWYYLHGSGAMATGWQCVDGSWYWFDASGAMAIGWREVGGSWYWFDGSGSMLSGWQKIGGTWYFFDDSGAMAHDRWEGDYYLTSSGAMATSRRVDGYWVGADGRWMPGV